MTDEQIELLKKALALYDAAIELRRDTKYEGYDERADYYYMRKALSEAIGVDVT